MELKVNEVKLIRNTYVVEGELLLVDRGWFHTKYWGENQAKLPIIVSKTEKIKKGDLYFDTYEYPGAISECYFPHKAVGHKILALPKDFSPVQLVDIFKGKIVEKQKVFLECYGNDTVFCDTLGILCKCVSEHEKCLKHYIKYPKGTIRHNFQDHIIMIEEEKLYSKSQLEEAFCAGRWLTLKECHSFEEWFNQNIK